jgi:hypothetical protein
VDLAGQVGRTIDLFDWTGADPAGAFDVSTPYVWDLSRLYTTGEVTLAAVPEPAGVVLGGLALLVVFFLQSSTRTRSPSPEVNP